MTDKNQDEANALHRRAIILQEQGNLIEAEKYLRQSIDRNPTQSCFHNNYGCLLGQRGWQARAATAFRLAIKLDPTYAKAHANLSASLVKEKHFAEAVREARLAIELENNSPEGHAALGVALAGLDRPLAHRYAFCLKVTPHPQPHRRHAKHKRQRGERIEDNPPQSPHSHMIPRRQENGRTNHRANN